MDIGTYHDAMLTYQVYERRLPAPQAIVGALQVTSVDIGEGDDITKVAKRVPDGVLGDGMGIVRDVIRASESRSYVLLGMGWWRVDSAECVPPPPVGVTGELTCPPLPMSVPVISALDLRVDDVLYASGLPRACARVLDVVHSCDGRGLVTYVRLDDGWWLVRMPTLSVAYM